MSVLCSSLGRCDGTVLCQQVAMTPPPPRLLLVNSPAGPSAPSPSVCLSSPDVTWLLAQHFTSGVVQPPFCSHTYKYQQRSKSNAQLKTFQLPILINAFICIWYIGFTFINAVSAAAALTQLFPSNLQLPSISFYGRVVVCVCVCVCVAWPDSCNQGCREPLYRCDFC